MQFPLRTSPRAFALLAALSLAIPFAGYADEPIEFVNPPVAKLRDASKGAEITIRGYKNGPIDILDHSGKVIERVESGSIPLNQSPPHVIARRKAALEDIRERARQYRADKQEQARVDAEEATRVSDENAKEQRIVELEATVQKMEKALSKPRRDRYTGRIVKTL